MHTYKDGFLTYKLKQTIGFKGLTFIIATIGLFENQIDSNDWVILTLSICGIKTIEDTIVRLKDNSH